MVNTVTLFILVSENVQQFNVNTPTPTIISFFVSGSQDGLHRRKAKLLVNAMESMNPNARRNVINALGNVKPSHLLDENLREACGLNLISGSVGETKVDTSNSVVGSESDESENIRNVEFHSPSSFIESLL